MSIVSSLMIRSSGTPLTLCGHCCSPHLFKFRALSTSSSLFRRSLLSWSRRGGAGGRSRWALVGGLGLTVVSSSAAVAFGLHHHHGTISDVVSKLFGAIHAQERQNNEDNDNEEEDNFNIDNFIQEKINKLKESIAEILHETGGEDGFESETQALVGGGEVDVDDSVSPTPTPVAYNHDSGVRVPRQEEDEDTFSFSPFESEDASFDWFQFAGILRPYWKMMTVAIGSAMAVAMINIQIPHLLGSVADVITARLMQNAAGGDSVSSILDEQDFVLLVKSPAVKLVGLFLLHASFTFTYIYSLSVVGEGVATELRRRLFTSMLNQNVVFFDTHMTGEIMSRLTGDIQEFKSSFKLVISQGLRNVSEAVGCLISLYLISPEMTKIVLIVVPSIIGIGTILGRGLRSLSRKAQEQVSKASGHAEETLSNIRTVRAFAMENEELTRYTREVDRAEDLNTKLGIGIGLFQAGSSLFLNGVVLSVLVTGGKLIATQNITSGELMAFLVAAQTIQKSLSRLSLVFGQYIRGLGAGARVFQYINLPHSYTFTAGPEVPLGRRLGDDVKGDVEFHNVWFRYPTRSGDYVLKRFNLKIPQGKVVAVVGPSGSGKSTIVNLLEGFYPTEKGDITVDGVRLEWLDPNWLRGQVIGLINQEPVLFASSIKENIRYGKPNATDEEVYEAARHANAYNFIQDFPEGFDTLLGERGVTVSGGQKQRIAIARALIKNPTILILDEATSALDSASEKIVQETLDAVSKGRTVLVIAHRLSTIRNADLIAVVADGKIAELGTHEELLQSNGLYYNLVQQQEYKGKT